MPTVGTATSSAALVPRNNARAPSCRTILRSTSNEDVYTSHSGAHSRRGTCGLPVVGHFGGHPSVARVRDGARRPENPARSEGNAAACLNPCA
jgi:hypothetical protein